MLKKNQRKLKQNSLRTQMKKKKVIFLWEYMKDV